MGFQQTDQRHSAREINATSFNLLVTSAQCLIGTGKHPDVGIILNYSDEDCSEGYSYFMEAFKVLTKDNILQPLISDHDFRSNIED